jgi:hypothetical protein
MDNCDHSTMCHLVEAFNGSVRPLLALTVGLAVVVFMFFGLINSDFFSGVVGMVLGYFFQARENEKSQKRLEVQQERLEVQQDKLVEAAKALPVVLPEVQSPRRG